MITEAQGVTIINYLQQLSEQMVIRQDMTVVVSWLCGIVVTLCVLVFAMAFNVGGVFRGR